MRRRRTRAAVGDRLSRRGQARRPSIWRRNRRRFRRPDAGQIHDGMTNTSDLGCGDVRRDELRPEPFPGRSVRAVRPRRQGPRYAQAGIREVWLVDLEHDRVLAYRDPAGNGYQVVQTLRRGDTLTTLGFGMGNFNDVLMEQLADKGNGNYAYIDSIEQAQKLFIDQLRNGRKVCLIPMNALLALDLDTDFVPSISQHRIAVVQHPWEAPKL